MFLYIRLGPFSHQKSKRPVLEIVELNSCIVRIVDLEPAQSALDKNDGSLSNEISGISMIPLLNSNKKNTESPYIAVAYANGVVKIFDTDHSRLQSELKNWVIISISAKIMNLCNVQSIFFYVI